MIDASGCRFRSLDVVNRNPGEPCWQRERVVPASFTGFCGTPACLPRAPRARCLLGSLIGATNQRQFGPSAARSFRTWYLAIAPLGGLAVWPLALCSWHLVLGDCSLLLWGLAVWPRYLVLPYFLLRHRPLGFGLCTLALFEKGGVPDSTLNWIAPLPVEGEGFLANPPSKNNRQLRRNASRCLNGGDVPPATPAGRMERRQQA